MKVKVKDLKPNPYRNIEKYPIAKGKVDALKASIKETTFWENILARQKNGHYELAYGHHRLAALTELGIAEIDIPIKDLSDSIMLKIMANENMNDWENNPSVIIETVRVSRDFLNAELAKYETWEECQMANGFISHLFDNVSSFKNCKRIDKNTKEMEGVGQTTILKFLGEPWKQHIIQEALAVLNSEKIYDKVLPIFNNMPQMTEFRQGINKINKERKEENQSELSEDEIVELAKKTKDRKEDLKEKRKPKTRTKLQSPKKEIENIIRQELGGDDAVADAEIKDLILNINKANSNAEQLHRDILSINTIIKNLDTVSISGNNLVFESLTYFSQLFLSYSAFMSCFGINFKDELKKLNK